MTSVEAANRLAEAVAVSNEYSSADLRINVDARSHIGLATMVVKEPSAERLTGRASNGALVCLTNPPFGIGTLVPTDGTLLDSATRLTSRLRADPESIASLVPPFALVQLHNDQLELMVDHRSLAEIYELEHEGISVWSNRIHLALLFVGRASVFDEKANGLRAAQSYFPSHFSPLKGVSRLEGATAISSKDDPQPPSRSSSANAFLAHLAAAGSKPFDVDVAAGRLVEVVSAMLTESSSLFGHAQASMGLTGGRDSRTILAAAIAAGLTDKIRLHTIDSMRIDTNLASQIIQALRENVVDLNWTSTKVPERQSRNYTIDDLPQLESVNGLLDLSEGNPLLARFLYKFHHSNGQVMPGAYFRPVRKPSEPTPKPIISGAGGEILRSARYRPSETVDAIIRRTLRSRFGIRQQRNRQTYVVPARRPTRVSLNRQAAEIWLAGIERLRSAGLSDARLFDVDATFGQQSRRIMLGRSIDRVAPLNDPELLLLSHRLEPDERATAQMQRRLSNNLVPVLASIPYSHEFEVPADQVRRDNSRFPPIFDETEGIRGFASILDGDLWTSAYAPDEVRKIFRGDADVNDYQKDRLASQLTWYVAGRKYAELLARYQKATAKSAAAERFLDEIERSNSNKPFKRT